MECIDIASTGLLVLLVLLSRCSFHNQRADVVASLLVVCVMASVTVGELNVWYELV